MTLPARVVVVGTGLIGTSIGLALTGAGVEVLLDDTRPARLRLAADLGAGRPAGAESADHAVLAVPPGQVAPVLLAAQRRGLATTYSDVASVKAAPLAAATALGCELSSYVGAHPMAGRERAGPGAARGDLFAGRPWVICPHRGSSPAAVVAASAVAAACGATPVRLPAAEHDAVVAVVSHTPQVTASLLAGLLLDAPAVASELAGTGWRDMTRIAASDPDLWADIAAGNAEPLAGVLARLGAELADVAAALRGGPDRPRLAAVFRRGNAGAARLPGKHGGNAPPVTVVPVVVADRPGELARLLADAAEVNVEDLRVEHSPGAPVGLVELAVRPEAADRLAALLRACGWSVHRATPAG